MHQPAATPRPSIYYDYDVHPAFVPPASRLPAAPVAIVGAGPVGLTLALLLARHGARSVVLESERQVSEGSRAIVFTRRSMEILQQAGVHESVTAMGLPWRVGHSHYRGRSVFRMSAPHPEGDRFGPLTNLQQQYLEQFLVEAAERHPLIELRWGQRVLGLAPDAPAASAPGGVLADEPIQGADAARRAARAPVLLVDGPTGVYRQPADWVVSTEGARSVLRQALCLRMEGDAYEGRFVIADIRIDLPLPTERLAFFDPPWNPGNTVLMHREPHGLWRIDFQLPPGETPEQALASPSLAQRIDAQLEMIGHGGRPWTMDWSSVYSARAMTLPDYRCEHVLFAGDAAHLLPIFGVRGANTGFQDAQNLGWKLALVARGLAGQALLDSYSAERVQAAREIIAEAGRSTRFMTPPSDGFLALRDATLGLSLDEPMVGPLFHWRTSRAHDHLASALNASGTGGGLPLDDDDRWPVPASTRTTADSAAGAQTGEVAAGVAGHEGPHAGAHVAGGATDPAHGAAAAVAAPPAIMDGAVLPGVRLGEDRYLLDALDGGVTWLHVAAVGPVPDSLVSSARALRSAGVPCRVAAVRRSLPACQALAGADLTLDDTTGQALARLGADGADASWLIRPDQHVAGRWRRAPSDEQARLAVARLLAANDGDAAVGDPAQEHDGQASAQAPAFEVQGTPLEAVYDRLAEVMDRVPADRRQAWLVKLALLLAGRAVGAAAADSAGAGAGAGAGAPRADGMADGLANNPDARLGQVLADIDTAARHLQPAAADGQNSR